jgi:uncharacterized protein (DUF1697 family)
MRYVCFLRAINVGGHNVTMAELKRVFEELGLDNVETFIASGNVIFDSRRKPQQLEKMISSKLRESLGYEVPSFLRTIPQLSDVAVCQPFDPEAHQRATAFNVAFTCNSITKAQHEKLAVYCNDLDDFTSKGSEIYWISKARQSESKFVSAAMEKNLGTPVTWRGINTVRRLVAKYAGSQQGRKS